MLLDRILTLEKTTRTPRVRFAYYFMDSCLQQGFIYIYLMPCTIDGNNDSTSIADMFSDKYDTLYNSVPYDTNHMKLIEREIMSHIQKCNHESYNI